MSKKIKLQDRNKKYLENKIFLINRKLEKIGAPGSAIVDRFRDVKPTHKRLTLTIQAYKELRKNIEEQIKYKENPVGIETFVTDKYYLNMPVKPHMDEDGDIYPEVLKCLKEMAEGDYIEIVCTGSIGSAKTTIALILLCYHLYLLSTLRDPHKEYSLLKSDEIVMIFQSLNAAHAKAVDYARFKAMIENSQYFQDNFMFDKNIDSEMQFPNRVIVKPVAGNATAAIGQNCISGLIDECLTGDTLIETSDGGTKYLQDIKVGDKVYTYNKYGHKEEDVITVSKCTGIKPVKKVVFDDGSSVVGTPNHPVATESGWLELGLLKEKDYVYAPAKRPESLRPVAREDDCCEEREEVEFVRRGEEETERSLKGVERNRRRSEAQSEKSCEDGRVRKIGRRQESSFEKGTKYYWGNSEVQRKPRKDERFSQEYEQYQGNKEKEIRIQQEKVPRGCAGHVEQRIQGKSCTVSNRRQALSGDQREDVKVENGLPYGERLHGEVHLCQQEMQTQQVQVNVRSTGYEVPRARHFSKKGRVREGKNTLQETRCDEKYNSRFPNTHGRGFNFTSGEKFLRSVGTRGEDTSYEEVCPEKWHEVPSMDRKRVVCVRELPPRKVYNIEAKHNHNYVANGVVVHNCNFMKITEKSKNSKDSGSYDQAQENYTSIVRRRESRFMKMGKTPGILCLVSSKRYPGEFTDRKIEEAKTNPKIYIYDKRGWDISPPGRFCGEKFRVFIGDATRKPRILEKYEEIPSDQQYLVDYIPIEYRKAFEADLLGSLRDIAGKSTLSLEPFIYDVEKVAACFGKVESVLSRPSCDFVETKLHIKTNCIRRKDQPRFVHIDLGLVNDCAGVSCGFVSGFKKVQRGGPEEEGNIGEEILPIIDFDFMLKVEAPRNDEIKFYKIRELIYKLTSMGMPIKWITFDSWQSIDSIQLLKREGYKAGIQSVDTTTTPYDITKSAFMDLRVNAPEHEDCQKELITLERDVKKNKIDHLPGQSKDVSDSSAAVIYGLTMRREIWLSYGISLSSVPITLLNKSNNAKNSIDKNQEDMNV